jgi:(p)ppGpp synthase/HD superfamily hydrolase
MRASEIFTSQERARYIKQVEWIIDCHEKTNHLYDDFIPYKFHLRLAAKHALNFICLIPQEHRLAVMLAVWGHDLIEDARVTYNDVKKYLGVQPADIIYAVTNMRGKDRSERANDEYYRGIRETRFANYVKLCDRMANLEYSRLVCSKQFNMYRKENPHFIEKIGITEESEYFPMTQYLSAWFEMPETAKYDTFII